ncbi:MAG: ABC transporter substrate-binding protein [Anaerolineae bacterium]|nr:ABC transporter substrate-binding protein [Anaerolineae bacterium]
MPVHKSLTCLGLGFLLTAVLTLTGCISTTPRTIKIGLVAPFEGRYREIGEEIIPAARLAIRQFAEQDGHPGVNIELVAYDDAGNPQQAIEQARRLAADPEVVAVVGHWRDETTQAASIVYSEAGLPLITFNTGDIGTEGQKYNLAPSQEQLENAAQEWLQTQSLTGTLQLENSGDIVATAARFQTEDSPANDALIGGPEWSLRQFYKLTDSSAEGTYFVTGMAKPGDRRSPYWTDERTLQFVAGFEEGSLRAPPGLFSISAYEATWLAISLAMGGQIEASPLTISQFNCNGRRQEAPIFLYRWEEEQREFVAQLR